MKDHWIGSLTAAAAIAIASLGWAAEATADGLDFLIDDDPSYLSAGVGYFDIAQGDDETGDLRLEYRHDTPLYFVKPWAGLEVTTDGAVYGVGGLLLDVGIGERIAVTGSLGAGAYSNGDGKDLGDAIEFRSQIEIAYRFDDHARLGLAFSHISNASIGDDNPGVEILTLYYHLPLSSLLSD